MPTTYNGVGTHYYGKSNITKRPGPCPHCHSNVELTSYDTRLWFVLFFIPLIPLGRKRIIDQCKACTRHYVVDIQKWETARQLEISGAQDEYRKNPSAETAVALHRKLLNFHQHQEAAAVQQEMAGKYAENAKVQAYLGAALEHVGKLDEAGIYYARALKLRPDLPEARIGVAEAEIRAGRLGEARNLLDFLQNQGASQLYSVQPLETLALAYQRAGQHQEALELFTRLLAELPKLGEVSAFRKMVAKSEKALGRRESMLPKRKFNLMRALTEHEAASGGASPRRVGIAVAIIAAVVGLGFVISNEYARRHRKIVVVNAFTQPAMIEIREAGVKTAARRSLELVLPEGRYHVSVTGPVREELELDIHTGYWSRWGNHPLWLINVGGAAALSFETAVYSRNPSPPTVEYHFGKSVEFFRNVTHPFEDLPESVQVKSGESRTLTRLDTYQGEFSALFDYLARNGKVHDALTLAEGRLRATPGDKELLRRYARYASDRSEPGRVDSYLKAGLTNRPIVIEWHRAWQHLHENPRELPVLLASYDALVKADPTNSALLYLRGRIDPDRVAARDYFQRAAAADSKNAYASFGLGYDRMSAGDWEEAKKQLSRAVEMSPEDPVFGQYLFVVRLALREAAALQKQSEERLAKNPTDVQAELGLIKALAAQGQKNEAVKSADAFQKRLVQRYGDNARSPATQIKCVALYCAGDFAELEKASAGERSSVGRRAHAEALLEQGRLAEAAKAELGTEEESAQGFWLLALAVGTHHAGDTNGAAA